MSLLDRALERAAFGLVDGFVKEVLKPTKKAAAKKPPAKRVARAASSRPARPVRKKLTRAERSKVNKAEHARKRRLAGR